MINWYIHISLHVFCGNISALFMDLALSNLKLFGIGMAQNYQHTTTILS